MQINEFYQQSNNLLLDFFISKRKIIEKVFESITKKNQVVYSKNVLEFLVIVCKDNKFFVTDRLLNPETSYIIDIRTNGIGIRNSDNVKEKIINLETGKVTGYLNAIEIAELFEVIIRGENSK